METEKSAVVHVPADEGTSLHLSGDTYTFEAVGKDAGGSLVLLEALVPPPHIHRAEEELFWLLEGEVEFLTNVHAFVADAGSSVYVPRGTASCSKNVSAQNARMLAAFMPPGIERMFFEVGRLATQGSSPSPPDQEET